jgi:hypothetical protein
MLLACLCVSQTSENELKRLKHHLEKAVAIISRIESEHLDYQVQMRRLQDVAARFAPMMHRLDGFLPAIQQELSLPLTAPPAASSTGQGGAPLKMLEGGGGGCEKESGASEGPRVDEVDSDEEEGEDQNQTDRQHLQRGGRGCDGDSDAKKEFLSSSPGRGRGGRDAAEMSDVFSAAQSKSSGGTQEEEGSKVEGSAVCVVS